MLNQINPDIVRAIAIAKDTFRETLGEFYDESFFMHGQCATFARLIGTLFPDTTVHDNGLHVVAQNSGLYYDASGCLGTTPADYAKSDEIYNLPFHESAPETLRDQYGWDKNLNDRAPTTDPRLAKLRTLTRTAFETALTRAREYLHARDALNPKTKD